jgi:hypothetical protein
VSRPRPKLPVPGPWQPAVEAAVADLCRRLDVQPFEVAVTRVADGVELRSPGWEPGVDETADLAVWLMAGGDSYRYLVSVSALSPAPVLVSGPTGGRGRP